MNDIENFEGTLEEFEQISELAGLNQIESR